MRLEAVATPQIVPLEHKDRDDIAQSESKADFISISLKLGSSVLSFCYDPVS